MHATNQKSRNGFWQVKDSDWSKIRHECDTANLCRTAWVKISLTVWSRFSEIIHEMCRQQKDSSTILSLSEHWDEKNLKTYLMLYDF